MKNILFFVMLSLFSLNTASADSFNQITFQGMKIGESLLKYIDEATIKATNNPKYKKNKYSTSSFDLREAGPDYFDVLDISFMTSDRSYKIVELGGSEFMSSMNECETERDKILNAMGELLNDAKKIGPETVNHPADKSGKSKMTDLVYRFDSGFVQTSCVDWSEEIGHQDHLYFSVTEKIFMIWKQKNFKY